MEEDASTTYKWFAILTSGRGQELSYLFDSLLLSSWISQRGAITFFTAGGLLIDARFDDCGDIVDCHPRNHISVAILVPSNKLIGQLPSTGAYIHFAVSLLSVVNP
jgi:hypothetical protein